MQRHAAALACCRSPVQRLGAAVNVCMPCCVVLMSQACMKCDSCTCLQMLLSPSVAFVRTILLEEMAKGLDSASRLAADTALQRLRDNLAAFGVRTFADWDLIGQAVPPFGAQPGP